MANPGPSTTQSVSNLAAPNVITSSYALTYGLDDKRVTVVQAAAGLTLTLPLAVGSGAQYEVELQTTVTSNSVKIQTGNTGTLSDAMQGRVIQTGSAGATTSFGQVDTAGSQTNTITLNGSTTGGLIGDRFIFTDAGNGIWMVTGFTKITGTAATPFSHV